MIKKLILAALVALPLSMSAQKFAVIAADEVLQALPEMTEVKAKIEAASKTYEDEIGKLRTEIEKKEKELQELDPATPDAIKQRRYEEGQELVNKLQNFYQQAQQDIQRQQAQLIQPLHEKILKAIETVGTQSGYIMVLPAEVPYYRSADVVDITAEVKKMLGAK